MTPIMVSSSFPDKNFSVRKKGFAVFLLSYETKNEVHEMKNIVHVREKQ